VLLMIAQMMSCFDFEGDSDAWIHWQYMLFSRLNTLFCILLNASPDVSTSIIFLHVLRHSILLLLFFSFLLFLF
jgi:hypothetical protein